MTINKERIYLMVTLYVLFKKQSIKQFLKLALILGIQTTIIWNITETEIITISLFI
jgi:hypothetical protein